MIRFVQSWVVLAVLQASLNIESSAGAAIGLIPPPEAEFLS